MKTMNRLNLSRAGALLSLALLGACATQKQYDAVAQDAKYYQTKLHEKELLVSKLQDENDRLKQQLKQSEIGALSEAGYGDDLQSRLSELQAKIDGLNRPLNDIERFEVEGGYVLMVQDKLLFESGSADLNEKGRTELQKLAADIQSRPHGRIWVRGHTDSDPVSKPSTKEKFPHGNLQLSAARAVEVGAELVQTGKVGARDVVVVGFGQHDPVKPNSSADNKRLNRRVEIFVSDAGNGAKGTTEAGGTNK
ncbi:MAG: OmpA family protein [Planctomycetes bacterium]|nr:OmpA family protein [Planctomycetota bacterium]